MSDEKPNDSEEPTGPPASVIDDGARSRWPLPENASEGDRARLGRKMAEAFWRDVIEVFGEDMNRIRMTVGCLKEFQLALHREQSAYKKRLTPGGEMDDDARELERLMAQASAKGDG